MPVAAVAMRSRRHDQNSSHGAVGHVLCREMDGTIAVVVVL
jgi:hypothetical protein